MNGYHTYIFGLLALYAIVPVPVRHFIESRLFKTRHITLGRGYVAWFATNVAVALLFVAIIYLLTLLKIYCNDVVAILLFAVMLFCVSPVVLILIFKKSFNYSYAAKVTLLQILIFLGFGWAMFGLQEAERYKNRYYRDAVFADSDPNEKSKMLTFLSESGKLKFPENTKLIYAQWAKGDLVVIAELEIDRKGLGTFESPLEKPTIYRSSRESFDGYGPRHLWKPLLAKNFRVWRKDCSDILLDLDNDSKIVVYLIYATI